ncbi:MAG: hypothetical protein FWD73_17530 [Polyangiaceae bacterium]|nr:hypothetical protein [Polyangiaceae bacterium]
MQWFDVLAAVVVLGAVVALVLGALALSRSNDVEALYFLVTGLFALRAAVQIARLTRPEAGS